MTFRDKMTADFAAMVANGSSNKPTACELQAMAANEPRPMPEGWAPDFHIEGNKCIARSVLPRVADVSLGFELTEDRSANGHLLTLLFRSVWQALELARLGQTQGLESMTIVT